MKQNSWQKTNSGEIFADWQKIVIIFFKNQICFYKKQLLLISKHKNVTYLKHQPKGFKVNWL